MVAILEKSEHNVDFHPIVDFVEASPLRIKTMEEGTKILATIDGILKTVTESSLRRNLKFKMRKESGQFSHQWKYLIHTIMQCLSPKSTGFNEFSSNIATALVCLATNRTYNFSKMVFDGLVKNVNNKGKGSGTPTEPHHTPSPEAQQTSHTTHSSPTLPPSSALPPVADEPASPLRDVSEGKACPTDSGFQADQDRANIAKTFTLPYDLAPRVTSPAAAEGSMQQTLNELTAFCTSLQRQHSKLISKFKAQELEINILKARVKLLEDREGVDTDRSGDDAPIKGKNLDEREAVAERVSDDTEEMATVLTSMETATVLSSGAVEVPTGSGSIPTAGSPATEVPTGSDVVPTASPVFATATVVTPYKRRKGKEIMVESETPKKKKVQKQIDAQVARELEEQLVREDQRMSKHVARDAEVARIHVEEELQSMIDGLDRRNETVAKYLQEYQQFALELPLERRIELISDLVRYQDNYAKVHKFQTQQRKPWSKKQKRDYYMAVIKSNLGWKVKDFRGMTFEEIEAKFTIVWKQLEDFIPMGSKEEAKRLKRKGLSLEQKSMKKLKTSEEVPEEAKSLDEVPEEKVKEMMQLVPIEEVYVEALQVKHPIIDWKVHTEGKRAYWKITRPPTSDKEMELWVELKRLYEPDDADQLWTHTQNLMHAPLEWRLYDTCRVHHVTAKDKEMFMLVEKDCPLKKGLANGMISYKLQGRIVRNKMHKAFPLPVIEFPLAEEVPTASEESCHCHKKRETTVVKDRIATKVKKKLIDVIDEILEEDFDAFLNKGSKILYSIEGTIIKENVFTGFDEFIAMNIKENSETHSDEEIPSEKITFNTDYKIKTSLEEPPSDLELKPLPDHLEYVFLEGPSFLPVIISSQFSKQNKSTKNVSADHLSRIENDETSDDNDVDDNFPDETLMEITTRDLPWFADFANYLVGDIIPKGMTYQQKNKFFPDIKNYFWEDPYLFKVCSDGMVKRCVAGPETHVILNQCHYRPTGRHYGPTTTAKKVLDSNFY
nr:reverse transcriptase domain-containing protein [Tanacetum cinerariifolium]